MNRYTLTVDRQNTMLGMELTVAVDGADKEKAAAELQAFMAAIL